MIAILHHPKIERSWPLCQEIADWLRQRTLPFWVGSVWDEVMLREKLPETRLLIVLGGDGSILRTARLGALHGVPLFSINLGKLGFLCEAEVAEWSEKLGRYLAGDYHLERRLQLEAVAWRNGVEIGRMTGLNEVVVGRGRQARLVRIKLSINGADVTTYLADALIIATPTGSTAYALAAGGPILPPELHNFIVVPVAAERSLDRPIVLPSDSVVTLTTYFDHEATLTADGQEAKMLADGDTIEVRQHPNPCLFVRTDDPNYFYRRLLARGVGLRRE